MRLGRLDRRIEIQQPVLAVNDYGERDKTYTVFHSCWAKVTERYGDEKDLSEVDYPVLRVSFFIRHKAGVLQQFRVLHEGFLYEILEVKEVTYSRNRYLELITERRGNQTGNATGAPVASDATYENSDGSFSQAISSGDTYVAPDITITDVDATTRDVPANTDVTCEWKTITVDNTDGVEKVSQATYPSGGAIELPDLNLRDGDGFSTDYPVPAEILINGRPIASATYASIGGNDLLAIQLEALPTVFPISIENGNGGVLGTITSNPSGTFDLGQIGIFNNTTLLGNFNRVSNNVRVVTASDETVQGTVTVEQNNATTIIKVPDYPTAASGICYKNIVPVSIEYSARTGDCADRFQDGEYDATPPARPEAFAEIDYAATQADVRGTPATGTSSTDLVSPTILKENNAFGNKFRYTDSAGNPSDASVGSNIWAHVDWRNHSFTGATNNYVIDNLYNRGLTVVYYETAAGRYTASDDGVDGLDWDAWMDEIAGITTYLGLSGWKPLDLPYAMASAHGAFIEPDATWADNFFTMNRAGNRGGFLTGEVSDTNQYIFLHDSGDANFTEHDAQSGGDRGFVTDIVNVFLVRKHFT